MDILAFDAPDTWGHALDEAVHALARGALVVMPTDTVYGVAADAFNPAAVAGLLAAKGRGRAQPPPVLVGEPAAADALAVDLTPAARALMALWPGALTLVTRAQPSIAWDLGDTEGTVALRMPDHPGALALLRRTGPLAVSSANLSGRPAAVTASDAAAQLGESVAVVLDGGRAPGGVASTIVDATGPVLRILRAGALPLADLVAATGPEAWERPGE